MTIEGRIKELNMSETENKELRITKRKGIEDGGYSDIYTVTLPVAFYFDKEGMYDGLSFETEDITEKEAELVEELLDKLADAEDMDVTDEFDNE